MEHKATPNMYLDPGPRHGHRPSEGTHLPRTECPARRLCQPRTSAYLEPRWSYSRRQWGSHLERGWVPPSYQQSQGTLQGSRGSDGGTSQGAAKAQGPASLLQPRRHSSRGHFRGAATSGPSAVNMVLRGRLWQGWVPPGENAAVLGWDRPSELSNANHNKSIESH